MELLTRQGLNIAAVVLSLLLHAAVLFGADKLIGAIGTSTSANLRHGGKITLVALSPAVRTADVDSENLNPAEVVSSDGPPAYAKADMQELSRETESVPAEPDGIDVPEAPARQDEGEVGSEITGESQAGETSTAYTAEGAYQTPLPRVAPEPLGDIQPEYPFKARKLGHEGTVVLELLISAEGTPSACEIAVSSGWPELDEAARKTVLESRFKPARLGARNVQDTLKLSVVFHLEG